jgi:hypothetical protein
MLLLMLLVAPSHDAQMRDLIVETTGAGVGETHEPQAWGNAAPHGVPTGCPQMMETDPVATGDRRR